MWRLARGNRAEFLAVEINGTGHRDSEDDLRPERLRMPVISLTTQQIRNAPVIAQILERYRAIRLR